MMLRVGEQDGRAMFRWKLGGGGDERGDRGWVRGGGDTKFGVDCVTHAGSPVVGRRGGDGGGRATRCI
jgi:hypothetical protein